MNLDPRVFPTILMLLDFIAAIPYAVQGDVRHAVYWVAAGVLTLTVNGDLWGDSTTMEHKRTASSLFS